MKRKIILVFSLAMLFLFWSACKDVGSGNKLTFTLLQTSDIHSHAAGYGASSDYTPNNITDNDGVSGGYTRIASLIANVRNEEDEEENPVVLVDSGDYFMGTVFDLAAADPVSLKFFQMVDYDAVTLGNHEFDWGPAGLAMLLSNGIANGFNVPIVATNTMFSDASTGDDGLEALANLGAIVNKKVLDLPNGLRIGILGVMGPTADSVAPVAAPVTFNHDYAFLQGRVNDLRDNDGVDVVIVLSHSGIFPDGSGDDADIAQNVNGIDIIASGHYHVATANPFHMGASNSVIFSPGEYGEYVSRLDVTVDTSTGMVDGAQFSLLPVDDTIRNRTVFESVVDGYRDAIDSALNAAGLSLTDVISKVSFAMELQGARESSLGNMAADALRAVGTSLAPLNDPNPVQVGIIPNGVIRDGIYPGKTGVVTFTDIFNAIPLGISPDTSQPLPGYPLISMYVTGLDLRNICEAGITLSAMMGSDFYLNFSGIRVDYNPAMAAAFMGVTAVYLSPVDDWFTSTRGAPIDFTDTTTLYHLIVDLYSLQMMGVVTNMGLTIVPRDSAGNVIPPEAYMMYRIDSDVAAGVQELKEWAALLSYLGTFFPASGDGIPSVVYGPGGVGMGRVNIMQ